MTESITLPPISADNKEGILVGLCNALLDVTVEVGSEYLAKYVILRFLIQLSL
jgi:hypothetical protein